MRHEDERPTVDPTRPIVGTGDPNKKGIPGIRGTYYFDRKKRDLYVHDGAEWLEADDD